MTNSGGIGMRAPPQDGLPPLRDVIAELSLTARKSLGQNFILDLNLTRRIARAAGPLAGHTVVEVGPGPGGLTRGLLAEGAERIIAIERDERVKPALAAIAARYPGQIETIFADAIDINWPSLVSRPAIIAANLPYGIATVLLVGWLEAEPWPPWWDRMVLMFQREVAERIVAAPGSKAYGRLAVLTQWRTEARIVLKLPPEAFTPPPKVESALVEFVPRRVMKPEASVKDLARLTLAAFGQRRKMLRSSLKQLGVDSDTLLARSAIDPARRGETLTIEEFARMAARLGEMNGSRGGV